jgi:hypothetical protein
MFALLMMSLFAVPCLAADSSVASDDVSVKSDDVTAEEVARTFEGNISVFLINIGREQKSPLLLASAAEFLKRNALDVESTEGDITADSLYAEAVAMAKEAEDADLVKVLEKQSRVVSDRGRGRGPHRRHGGHRPPPVYYYPPLPPGKSAEERLVMILLGQIPPHNHFPGDPHWPW